MPWNDNAGSGGKPDKKPGGKPSPWGAPPSGGGSGGGGRDFPPRGPGAGGPQRPRRPGGGGPEFNDLGRRAAERLREYFRGGDGGGVRPSAIAAAAAGVLGIWALSGIYVVQSDEVAVVTTFGAYYGYAGPGLHIRAPWPIQNHQKVSVTTVQRTVVGGEGAQAAEESLMLTSDENIIDLDFTVQWRIDNAPNYLFNVADPISTVKSVAESAMREVVGKTTLQPLLTTARGQAQDEARALMQEMLDNYRSGIIVTAVLIDNSGPPPPVVEAFRQVTAAEQQAESIQNVARGEAAKIVQEARAYASQARLEAEGEAARFNQLYGQYKLAPAVTRDRLYIETMQRVLNRANKVVIDAKGATAPIILPPDVFRPRPTVVSPQAAPTAGATR